EHVLIGEAETAAGEELIRRTFAAAGAQQPPDTLPADLENALGHGRQAWPLAVIRRLADVLLAVGDGRRLSPRHEARWLNLTGFCLRPGFGTTLDPFRVAEARRVYAAGLHHPKDIPCQIEWLILWQRVSAGFNASQQQELANRLAAMLGLTARKAPRLNAHMLREAWRLVASRGGVDGGYRTRLGDELLGKVRREPTNAALLWAIGRVGARVPLYGPLNAVVPAAAAERWLEGLLGLKVFGGDAVAATAQIAARTGDPLRDIGDDARAAVAVRLGAAAAPAETLRRLQGPVAVDLLAGGRIFGEALPEGLPLDARPDEASG